jgi:chemotaxis signal transduction protein
MAMTFSSTPFSTPTNGLEHGLLVLQIRIAEQLYAIRADCVQRVLPIAAWISQPNMPDHVVGMLRLEHQVLPVVDARVCLGFETCLPKTQDHLLLIQAASLFLIWIDQANVVRDWIETDTLLNLEIFDPAVYP